jgi:two-component system, OmpR family, phosphate regulon sensor histidine kinase PhoR
VRLTQRLLLQTLGIIAILVASVVVIIDNRIHHRIIEETTLELSREAKLVAIEWTPATDADALADRAGAVTGHRVTLIDPQGVVIGDTDFDGPALARLENHSRRPEVLQAKASGVGSSLRLSPSTGEEQLYVAVTAPLGVARVSVTTNAVETIFDAARRDVLIAGFISLLLASALAALFSRAVSRPIVELRDVARALAAGQLDARPALSAPGEVGDLADALHRLGEQLGARLLALQTEQSRLSALVDSLNEGVIAIAPDHRVTEMSAPAREMLDISAPLPFSTDFLPRDPTLRRAISDALSGRNTGPVEIVLGKRTVSLNARPLKQGGAVIALFDLTPAKHLEAVRRDFVANVSHELRTPLTVIGGFAETLADPLLSREKVVDFSATILTHARRMQRLVDDLLDLSRIESGGWTPKPETIAATVLFREMVSASGPAAAAKGLQLRTSIAPGAEIIWADRTAVAQMILNLVENAIRHTARGAITIGACVADEGTEIFVADTGSGITAAHLSRIFERFYRVDTGRAREMGGTGLGLAIVKHLAEAHGGSVSAASEVDKGTTIRIFLPRPAAES